MVSNYTFHLEIIMFVYTILYVEEANDNPK